MVRRSILELVPPDAVRHALLIAGQSMQITRAEKQHIPGVARLFDLYRQFYECDPDYELAERFISQRMHNDESIIFVAVDDDGTAAGFTQLYPSFCSVEAVKILILYDLYVDASYRKHGVGRQLMNRATDYARETGAARLDLLTHETNKPGQALYESLGYHRANSDFYAYSLDVNSS